MTLERTVTDLLDEVRALRKELAGERNRNAQRLLHGTVEETQGSKVKVRLADEGDGGGPVLTPFIRIASPTGKAGGGVSRFTKLGVGDPVIVVSPNGEVGPLSAAMPGIDSEDRPSPGAAEQDGEVIEIGDTALRVRGGEVIITTPKFLVNAAAIEFTGASFKHNGKNIGHDHKHKDVTPGGALTGPPP